MELTNELLKRMGRSDWKCVEPLLDMNFKHEGEKYSHNIFTMYVIRMTKMDNLRHVSKYSCLALIIKLKLRKVTNYFLMDRKINTLRKTTWDKYLGGRHSRYGIKLKFL